jgi:hypothetical protein
MARTWNDQGGRRRRNWWDRETTWARRWSVRQYRAKCRQLMREGVYELPAFKRTGGWITW